MFPQILASTVGQLAAQAPALRETARTKRAAVFNSGESAEMLGEAMMRRIKEVGNESDRSKTVRLEQNIPESAEQALRNNINYAGFFRSGNPDTKEHLGSIIRVNPLAANDVLAHEMGHHVTDNTDIGHMVANLRHNPKLSKALAGAALGLPFLHGALQEGDDDVTEGAAIAALLSAPTIVDEALATKNGLAIMKDAGLRADAGQKARLAGALLSYMAAPVIGSMIGTGVGNVLDDHTAIYDL